jgi:hypothetical protein
MAGVGPKGARQIVHDERWMGAITPQPAHTRMDAGTRSALDGEAMPESGATAESGAAQRAHDEAPGVTGAPQRGQPTACIMSSSEWAPSPGNRQVAAGASDFSGAASQSCHLFATGASNGTSRATEPVAYHARMRSGGKACWKTILLETPGGGGDAELSRPERLAALYRFQNGEAPVDVRLIDPHRQAVVTDPGDIDWTHFPVVDALEAVTRDELNRLRSLLRTDRHYADNGAPEA